MKQTLNRFIRQIASHALNPIRRRFEWADHVCAQIASVNEMLFGEPGSTTKTLHEHASRRVQQLETQHRMRAELTPDDREKYFTSQPPSLTSSRLCDVNEMALPEFRAAAAALHQDPADIHRKYWEKAAVAHLAFHFGYCDGRSTALGLGVGRENLLYLFANQCGMVTGIDRYDASSAGMTRDSVYVSALFTYDKTRLRVQSMDMRKLEFEEDSFDFVWSISAVEHVDSIDDIIQVFREIERVLKPKGRAFITSEWNLIRRNPLYEPGSIFFDEDLYPFVFSKLWRLRPSSPLNPQQQYHPAHFFAMPTESGAGVEIRPCINVYLPRDFCNTGPFCSSEGVGAGFRTCERIGKS